MKKNKERYIYAIACVVLVVLECILGALKVPYKDEVMVALLGVLGGVGFLPQSKKGGKNDDVTKSLDIKDGVNDEVTDLIDTLIKGDEEEVKDKD